MASQRAPLMRPTAAAAVSCTTVSETRPFTSRENAVRESGNDDAAAALQGTLTPTPLVQGRPCPGPLGQAVGSVGGHEGAMHEGAPH